MMMMDLEPNWIKLVEEAAWRGRGKGEKYI